MEKGNPSVLLVGMQTGAATVENSMEFPQKINNGAALWSSYSTLGNVSKEIQNTNSKEHKHPYIHCSVTYNCRDMEAAQVPISKWVDKKAVVHLQNGNFYSAVKKEEILPFGTAWMDLENIMLSEISQSEKEKYYMISLTCGI